MDNSTSVGKRVTTMADVAARAHVSYQTVSNAMNAPSKVKVETLRRVQAAMVELNYRPNQSARQMRSGKSFNLAYCLPPQNDGIGGAILDTFLHALTQRAQASGYRLLLITAQDTNDELQRYLDLKQQNQIDGVVLARTHHGDQRTTALLSAKLPFTTFGRPWGDEARHSWVDVDGAAGTASATQLLIDRGHQLIGFLGWPQGSGAGDDRHQGWATTLFAATAIDPVQLSELRTNSQDNVSGGALAAAQLYAKGVTAIVCASDSLAFGAVTWARQNAPELAPNIIGFDNTVVSQALNFSSIEQPVAEAARICFEQVSNSIATASALNHLLKPRVHDRGLTPATLAHTASPSKTTATERNLA